MQRDVAVGTVLFRLSLELLLKLFYFYFRPVTYLCTLCVCSWWSVLAAKKKKTVVQWKNVAYIEWGEELSCQCCTQICLPCVKW